MSNWRKPLIFFLLQLTGSNIPKNLKTITKLDALSVAEKETYQKQQLEKLLLHAYKNVPYYSTLLPAVGVIDKNNTVDISRFKDIPILTKEIIREQGTLMYASDHKKRKSYINTSGGSTGQPIEILQDKNYSDWNIANKIFIKLKRGQDIGEKEMRLWGSMRDTLESNEGVTGALKNFLYNRKDINTFKLSEADIREIITIWNTFKPTWIEGYVNSLQEIAQYIAANSTDIFAPKGLLSSAGTLYPDAKAFFKEQYNSPVYNRYGSREVGDIACTAADSELHEVGWWNNYVEVLDDNHDTVTNNALGEAHITNLNNYAMPLIRYAIGDTIRATANSSFEVQSVEGKLSEHFINIYKEKVHAGYFRQLLFYKKWIQKYQIIQEDYTHIVYAIVPYADETVPEADIKEITMYAQKMMGKECVIEFKFVQQIEPNASGKYLYTISKLV